VQNQIHKKSWPRGGGSGKAKIGKITFACVYIGDPLGQKNLNLI
jgi:hypothetical protein